MACRIFEMINSHISDARTDLQTAGHVDTGNSGLFDNGRIDRVFGGGQFDRDRDYRCRSSLTDLSLVKTIAEGELTQEEIDLVDSSTASLGLIGGRSYRTIKGLGHSHVSSAVDQ